MKGLPALVLVALLVPLLISCHNPVREQQEALLPRDSIIPEPVMVDLLADLHLVEAGLLVKRNHGQNISGLPDLYYKALFAKYGISEARFSANLTYYQWNPEEYSALYEKVIAELNARNNWLPGKKPEAAGDKKPVPEE